MCPPITIIHAINIRWTISSWFISYNVLITNLVSLLFNSNIAFQSGRGVHLQLTCNLIPCRRIPIRCRPLKQLDRKYNFSEFCSRPHRLNNGQRIRRIHRLIEPNPRNMIPVHVMSPRTYICEEEAAHSVIYDRLQHCFKRFALLSHNNRLVWSPGHQ